MSSPNPSDLDQLDAYLSRHDSVFWAEQNFYIEDSRDLETGDDLGMGPIVFAEHQKRLLRAALERDDDGNFYWTTIIWSEPKKSGKTRIAGLVGSWLAYFSRPYSEIYCLANDGKQANDRVLAAIKRANDLAGWGWKDEVGKLTLPTGSFVEAVPVDPAGEAGSQPLVSLWSEMWAFRLAAKKKLWAEMTIPPTRFGEAIRWVESYAGYTGESPVLEKLYHQGVEEGKPHPDLADLPVYINERARLFCYWSHTPRMPWQTKDYYAQEAELLTESEFRRMHRNEWVDSAETVIPVDRWDAIGEDLKPVGEREPIVVGVDAGVSGDLTALVVASVHPDNQERYAIRAVEVWEPPKGEKIDYSQNLAPALRRWCLNHNVVCVVYDTYQLEYLAKELSGELGQWFASFPQAKGSKHRPGRHIADKQFYDMVIQGKLAHDKDPVLRQHVKNAAGRSTGGKYLHFEKKMEYLHIDALVAASMAVFDAARLNLV